MLNSIVLNIHCEGELLLPTLRSLDRAVAYADNNLFELVAVLDRSDEVTQTIIDTYDFSQFVSVRILKVDLGSLGLSRNAGIENASGDFIFLADSDDLVSYNYFLKTISEREKNKNRNIVYFPEIYSEFGNRNSVFRHYGEPWFSPLMFFSWHPFGSRISAYKEVFTHVPFAHIPVSAGYAYEDWHHNAALLAADYRFHVVDDVIVFYRRSKNSLSNAMVNMSINIPPASAYFKPDIYTELCHGDYFKYRFLPPSEMPDPAIARQRAAELKPLYYDAHAIEPGINQNGEVQGVSGNNLNHFQLDTALAYYEICSIVKGMTFDHIVLMPFITKGGAEKYLFNILDELCRQNLFCRILIITGEYYNGQTWDEKLPVNAVYIELPIMSGIMDSKIHRLLTLRLIEATARPDCNIHVFPCFYSDGFFDSYRSVLKPWRFVFYHFCGHFRIKRGKIKKKETLGFFRKNRELCSLVISDNVTEFERKIDKDNKLADSLKEKFKCIYTVTEVVRDASSGSPARKPKIFWASRIDKQKRITLIPLIGEKLAHSYPDDLLQVYGYSALDPHLTDQIKNADNIQYCGSFNGLSSLPADISDIFVYTSYVDGLPNVILEAIAIGIVVIAPDVGGIKEIIKNNETGVLLPSLDSDEDMAQAYAAAILDLVHNPEKRLHLVQNAQALLKQQHSYPRFSQSVADAFPLSAK